MHTPADRIEELIAASVAGDLTPHEQDELRRLALDHPWIEDELARLREVAVRVQAADIEWDDVVVTQSLRERVLGDIPARAPTSLRSRRPWATALVGAACLVLGLALGAGIPALGALPPTGPPGTLGAYEPIAVAEETGLDIDADLVAHTWGTEAVLDIEGLTAGATYRVVFIGADGAEFPAGEMLGSTVAIHCRLNAAVLREETVRLEIRDAGSVVVASSDLPDV
ncbi:hypothetical protein GCM10009775_05560 [Microbacterium aoyamense]|uniref:Anti-sigma factor n=1 Tax=Microbacterium aoyamense TaxID=344166 RepID=A0ABN2P9L1_9MICO|nr:hypothetical protein [Microbacterium aoyamense]